MCRRRWPAIDLALWDRAGRRAGQARGGAAHATTRAGRVPVNATLTALDRAGAAEQAARGRARRVRLPEAEGRASATTPGGWPRCGPRPGRATALRLDANGAWERGAGGRGDRRALARRASSWSRSRRTACGRVREVRERVAVRVAIDETAAEPGRSAPGVADAVCLKISRCGGIAGLLAAAALVRASRRGGLSGLDLRRPARGRRGRPRRRRARLARAAAALRPRDAGAVRGSRGPAAGARRARSRCPPAPGSGSGRF